MMIPKVFVITGPSGVGKGTLIAKLLGDWPAKEAVPQAKAA